MRYFRFDTSGKGSITSEADITALDPTTGYCHNCPGERRSAYLYWVEAPGLVSWTTLCPAHLRELADQITRQHGITLATLPFLHYIDPRAAARWAKEYERELEGEVRHG